MGYSKEQVLLAYSEVSETSESEDISSVWLAVMCRLRENEVYNLHSESQNLAKDCQVTSESQIFRHGNNFTI